MAKEILCSFCNVPESKALKLIKGVSGQICSDCVKAAEQEIQDTNRLADDFKDMSPSAIVKYLDEYVVGQKQAKKILACAFWNHLKRSFANFKMPVQKSNVWLIGDSGTGKTLLVERIAKYLDVPFASIDCSTLTETGYVGADVDEVISKLYKNAEGNVEATQKGIVFLDEIDKLAKSGNNMGQRDIRGAGVQQSLLRMIEGDIVQINPNGKKKSTQEPTEQIDTRDILFILGGAFVGLQEQKHKTPIGIEKQATKSSTKVSTKDLMRFGMLPEIIGRVPIIAQTEQLSNDNLVRILVEPKDSIVSQFQALLMIDGIKLVLDDSFLSQVAQIATKQGTNARGLRAILESSLLDLMYSAPDRFTTGKRLKEPEEVVLTAKDVVG